MGEPPPRSDANWRPFTFRSDDFEFFAQKTLGLASASSRYRTVCGAVGVSDGVLFRMSGGSFCVEASKPTGGSRRRRRQLARRVGPLRRNTMYIGCRVR